MRSVLLLYTFLIENLSSVLNLCHSWFPPNSNYKLQGGCWKCSSVSNSVVWQQQRIVNIDGLNPFYHQAIRYQQGFQLKLGSSDKPMILSITTLTILTFSIKSDMISVLYAECRKWALYAGCQAKYHGYIMSYIMGYCLPFFHLRATNGATSSA